MDIAISRARRADAGEFYRLEAKCFDMENDSADTVYYWVPILSYQCCYKATIDGKIVGGIVSMPTFEKRWYLNSLFVDPAYRRAGIATKLMEKMFKAAWQEDMILDVKTDRPHLLAFYESFGFRNVKLSKDHYYDDSDRFLMVRDVTDAPGAGKRD